MKILAFTEDSPYIAGANLVFVRLCRLLGTKHGVVLLSNHGSTEEILDHSSEELRFNLPRYPFSRFASFVFFIFTVGFREALRKDVILVNAGMTAVLGLALARLTRRKAVAYQHDVFFLEELLPNALGLRRKIIAIIRYRMYQGFMRHFDSVLAPSPETERRLRRLGCKKIYVTGNPIFGDENV
jgi:hypothetical protein